MLISLYNAPMDCVEELLQWFEEEHADPALPGGIVKKIVHYGKPIRIQYFVNWPSSASARVSPTSEKPSRKVAKASRVRVIHG